MMALCNLKTHRLNRRHASAYQKEFIMKWSVKHASIRAGISLVAIGCIALPASAQEVPCGCNVPFGAIGAIRAAAGQVFVSNETGFRPARVADRFNLPVRIISGPASSSRIEIGAGCQLNIAANQSLDVRDVSGRWCVSAVDGASAIEGAASAVSGGASGAASAAVGGMAVTGVAVGAAVIAIDRNDDRVSR
ncbi:hypothetical protein PX860_27050 (plasmid) [Agrobacterium leguminum]|uniref:hypothetical protein n=1 Tax=Agrobacterium leguminum TaxID=2792015 RepID=UPI00272D25B6|nr:hypothetical protein [Agrobacterium leguminum]WLE00542.1 hypothetical protein PX860_27050 [Agrobacterium leguminum]